MMNKKGILMLLLCLLVGATAFAQGRKGLVINEVMVLNDSNYVDDYGQTNAWVELYNSTYASMQISSIFLTNDPEVKTMYPVPRGDVNTVIPARQHILFWADGEPERGTFHLNFKLTPGQDNWIGVYDADGLTLIDSITVPASLGSNQSFARKVDGKGTGVEAWSIREGHSESYVTPSSNNVIIDTNAKKEGFKKHDSHGFAMALMAMSVVFSALLILSLAFLFVGKLSEKIAVRNKIEAHGDDSAATQGATTSVKGDSGEEI
ncbi:MAG: OadG family transporter subunit, partial [Muribaculaceae bacterium]|nr:OadG family transporter subunit [Muribaculaceae bacterium]